MRQLGSIQIKRTQTVREARKKVRQIAELLKLDPLTAIRLATVTSEVGKSLLQSSSESEIAISLLLKKRENALVIGFVNFQRAVSLDSYEHFFDKIRGPIRHDGSYRVEGLTYLPDQTVNNRHLIGELEKIVQQKGRDELMFEIKAKNLELEESLENLKKTRSAKERMESELNVGREIQMSMLPFTFPAFPDRKDFDIFAALYPAREVGGDFYDLFLIDNDHLCFCIGDVSGKGVPAALFMAVTKTLVKSRAANDLSPSSILSHVNTELAHRNDSCMFVTVFLGILNLNDGSLVFCNAGHNPPYLKRDDGKLEHLNQRHGPIIGAVEGIAYKEDRISIKPDDIIFLYTDGVTEAMNEDQTLYSDDRLIDLLESNELESAEHAVGVSVDDVWRFQGDAEQADDVTVMSVAYYGAMAAEGAELEIRIANKLEEIVRANDEFNEFAARHDLPDKLQQKLNLVFDELLNNTITYGFDDDREDHEIGIDVRLTEDMISLVIWDDGKPFNPFEEFAPDTTLSVSERPIGGLGIHLVRNLMDEISYKRHGERNELTLRKKIDKGNDA